MTMSRNKGDEASKKSGCVVRQTRTIWILVKDSMDTEWDSEAKERVEEPSVRRYIIEKKPREEDACVHDAVCD